MTDSLEIDAGQFNSKRPVRTTLLTKSRLALALAATVTLLPYAWARAFLIYLMTGIPDWGYAGMMAVGVIVVMLLTFRLSSKFQSPHAARNVGLLVAAIWTAVIGCVVIFNAGQLISPYVVAAAFLPATVWVVWSAWMFFAPLRAQTRVCVLVLALASIFPFVLFFSVEGLTGAAKVNFNYRNRAPSQDNREWQEPTPSARKVSLTANGKHEFTQFQGPSRSAVLTDVRLARDWSSAPPKVLWRVPVGTGWSGFAVAGEGAVTQEQRGEQECVVCRNLVTGEEVWVHADKASYDNALGGPGPRATPTIDGGMVFAIGATGILNCLEGDTGKVRWRVNILEDNDTDNAYHGVCGSPLIVGDFVVVCPTGKDGKSLAAYDRQDGHRVWVNGDREASYSSPMLADVAGIRQILYYNESGIAAHDPATGDLLWSFPWSNSEKVVCSQPIVLPGESGDVLLTTGYGGGV